MIRRDMVIDPDRPHFYSQFWVDVASGKHAASAESAETETATALETLAPVDGHEGLDGNGADFDGLESIQATEAVETPAVVEPEAPVRPVPSKKAEPKKAEPKKAEAITSLADLAKIDSLMKSSAEMDSDTIPDIEGAVASPNNVDIITDFDPSQAEPEVEEPLDALEPEFGADEYDEEDDWGEGENEPRRGSKPNKRRDTRRDSRDVRRDF